MAPQNTSFLQACAGERPAHTPIWLMRQAGRYLPEYRAIRSNVSFVELCHTPELCAEVTLQPIDRFGLDAAILFSDILVVFDAMGVRVDFTPAPVVADPVRTRADVERLQFGDPADALGYVYDAISACKKALADRVPLIGFCGAPFTTLSYMVEGKGSRDFQYTKTMMFGEPVLFGRLMESITTVLIGYLKQQVASGVDALQIFDSWAGALAPADYREHVLPHLRRLCQEVRGSVPLIMFARGNANLLQTVCELPADVIGIDWSIEMDDAVALCGPDRVVQGNLDPMTMLGNREVVRQKTHAILRAGQRAGGHIFNFGHGISRYTDPEMVRFLVDTVHAYRPEDSSGAAS